MNAKTQARRPRMLMLPIRHKINPYFGLLKRSLEATGTEMTTVRQLCSLSAPEAVLVHWQENYWTDQGGGALRRGVDSLVRATLLRVLRSLRRRGSTVVWFAHNQTPHAWKGSTEEWFIRSRPFFAEVDCVAHLSEVAPTLPGFAHIRHLPRIVIRHPHYELVQQIDHAAKAGSVQRVLLLGGLERRKNAWEAVRVILETGHLTAVLTGRGRPMDLRVEPSRVQLIEGFLDDAELYGLFDGGTAVLLNQVHQVNSGVMYLALSRGAPVLCPDTPVNREIQSLVGTSWIRIFEPPLTASSLCELTREPISTALPDLTPFSPILLGQVLNQWIGTHRQSQQSESFDARTGLSAPLLRTMDTVRSVAENLN